MNYKHTQIGYLMIYVMVALVSYFAFILIQIGFDGSIFFALAIILALIASFVSLTVTIDSDSLRIKFGYGLYKKSFKLKKIASVKIVKNHWYFGWGIRVWFWPYMRIFNISGFDAVEIIMSDGKIFRIGTDEPKQLEQALIQVIK
ncbi:hypothetical protein COT97_00490 [Candidatus Falkowbacteria bacterium CG10_big_fil_rev_8_21_14_0_10_39_11]|uniref:DUF304 domain-containing protein n=1 Tax=Candidatus Falkowbacteria bacterium CG10_big_fil_rev_8_21_14_0_10_39_11 TaxID=1974565 RepID=A0A2H0V683_9BACT|nr:MAG: hypothetical protein COT97_00490 [Candidatus Falkowbacteria bacterium CG10_big_fil_rev_8_21_14_0_10_39_11]